MSHSSYLIRRGQLETYFDRTAADAWSKLTSDAPVSRIRQTVRAGRDSMRRTILDWLPADLTGARVLDAGCGTGTLAVAVAARGADVVAVDLSPRLIGLAQQRSAQTLGSKRIAFQCGDMLDPGVGRFDYVVAMDSLIHYGVRDMTESVARLATRARHSVIFTFAPRTPALTVMHAIGQLFPRSDRSPAIQPVSSSAVAKRLQMQQPLLTWNIGRSKRIASGFYISQALEVLR
jgi:magnesium-protoporphyrin O-methyltransferase